MKNPKKLGEDEESVEQPESMDEEDIGD